MAFDVYQFIRCVCAIVASRSLQEERRVFDRLLSDPIVEDATAESRDLCTIGEAARIVGIEAKTIRFYEKAGLFHPSRASGTRIFRFEDIAALRVIKMLRALGVSVKEIKRVMTCAHFESRAAQHSPCLVKLVEEQLMRQRKEVEILQHNLSVAELFLISTAA